MGNRTDLTVELVDETERSLPNALCYYSVMLYAGLDLTRAHNRLHPFVRPAYDEHRKTNVLTLGVRHARIPAFGFRSR